MMEGTTERMLSCEKGATGWPCVFLEDHPGTYRQDRWMNRLVTGAGKRSHLLPVYFTVRKLQRSTDLTGKR